MKPVITSSLAACLLSQGVLTLPINDPDHDDVAARNNKPLYVDDSDLHNLTARQKIFPNDHTWTFPQYTEDPNSGFWTISACDERHSPPGGEVMPRGRGPFDFNSFVTASINDISYHIGDRSRCTDLMQADGKTKKLCVSWSEVPYFHQDLPASVVETAAKKAGECARDGMSTFFGIANNVTLYKRFSPLFVCVSDRGKGCTDIAWTTHQLVGYMPTRDGPKASFYHHHASLAKATDGQDEHTQDDSQHAQDDSQHNDADTQHTQDNSQHAEADNQHTQDNSQHAEVDSQESQDNSQNTQDSTSNHASSAATTQGLSSRAPSSPVMATPVSEAPDGQVQAPTSQAPPDPPKAQDNPPKPQEHTEADTQHAEDTSQHTGAETNTYHTETNTHHTEHKVYPADDVVNDNTPTHVAPVYEAPDVTVNVNINNPSPNTSPSAAALSPGKTKAQAVADYLDLIHGGH